MNSTFLDRRQAGQVLAAHCKRPADSPVGWVLALPRGGVPIGFELALALHWPLDVWLVRKLGAPNQPELAMGAIAAPNTQILNQELIQRLHVSADQLQAIAQQELTELQRRDQQYRQGRPLPDIAHKSVILVDDGLATGATMTAAIAAVMGYHPQSITIAVPVAAASSLEHIRLQVDQVICPVTPRRMGSISQWYTHFDPVTDDEVIALLQAAAQSPSPPQQ